MTDLFQKRHFEWLADWAGSQMKDRGDWSAMMSLANDLKATNPKFDRERFISHCHEIHSGQRIVRSLGDSYKPRPAGMRKASGHSEGILRTVGLKS